LNNISEGTDPKGRVLVQKWRCQL